MAIGGATTKINRVNELRDRIRDLTEKQVLVGVPQENAGRQEDGSEITNAALAYIHTNGAPEQNIPARPFLKPGIERVRGEIVDRLKTTAKLAMRSRSSNIDVGLGGIGQIAASSAQMVIQDGISPPLAESTIAARRRRSKGSSYRRKATSESDTTPLYDTGQLLRAITWVLRRR